MPTPGRAPTSTRRAASARARPAGCSASTPTPSAAGRTRAASRRSRPPAATAGSSGVPWSGSSPPAGPARPAPSAASATTTDRLNAAYRRRYGEVHGGGPRSACDRARRPARRASARPAAARRGARPLPRRDRRRPDARRARGGRARGGARGRASAAAASRSRPRVSMFVAARRPFLAELAASPAPGAGQRRRVGQLYDASTGLLDRLLLAFVAAHATTGAADDPPRRRRPRYDHPAGPDLDPGGRVRRDAARPVARTAPRLPARLGVRDAVLRASAPAPRRSRPPTAGTRRIYRAWYLTGADLDRRLARPRDGVPARADAVRLHVRGAAPVRGADHVRDPQLARTTRAPAPLPFLYLFGGIILSLAIGVETYFVNPRWTWFAGGAMIVVTLLSLVLVVLAPPLPAPGLLDQRGDRPADRRGDARLHPAADAAAQHHGRRGAAAGRAVLGLRVHAQEAGAAATRSTPASRASSSCSTCASPSSRSPSTSSPRCPAPCASCWRGASTRACRRRC